MEMIRGRRTARQTTEDCHGLDIRTLAREGFLDGSAKGGLQWTRAGGGLVAEALVQRLGESVKIGYWRAEDDEVSCRVVGTDRTRCAFGGTRVWFRCNCGRRVAILYLRSTGLLCRQCLGLTYETQRLPDGWRALRRANKIRQRLGGGKVGEPFPGKPKGMHWSTYWRITRRYEGACGA